MLACKDSGYDWFEQLLQNVSSSTCRNVLRSQQQLLCSYFVLHLIQWVYFLHFFQLLKSEENASYKPAKKACVQLVDNLVEHILKYEESLAGTCMLQINVCVCVCV